jgi:4-hydroxy-tetrahydrodipicolinate synthase
MADRIDGIFNIMATPFDADDKVDVASLRNLINFQIDKGAHGLTIIGVLGEVAKLNIEERQLIFDTVMETVNGRIPIVVGTSHSNVKTVIDLTKAAFAGGADGVMIAPPALDQPIDDNVIAFYSEVANAVDQPIVAQDFPLINNVIMSPDLVATLAEKIPNFRHLKLEDPPLMQKIGAILERTDKIRIFGGLGGMFLLEELNRGAHGTMTGFAFTEVLIAIYDALKVGDKGRATDIFDKYLPLIRFENQPVINLTIRKFILYKRGAIAHPLPREPYAPIDEDTKAEVEWMMSRVGITDPTAKINF